MSTRHLSHKPTIKAAIKSICPVLFSRIFVRSVFCKLESNDQEYSSRTAYKSEKHFKRKRCLLKKKLRILEDRSGRNNIRVEGIPGSENEGWNMTEAKLKKFI